MSGELSFFEIGAGDAGAARAFYGALFGWDFAEPPSGEGAVIRGSNVPGGIHGGDPGASPYLFFRVDDLDDAIAHVLELGGDVAAPDGIDDPETVARFGRFAFCTDDQGSSFGLHQPPPPEPVDPGAPRSTRG